MKLSLFNTENEYYITKKQAIQLFEQRKVRTFGNGEHRRGKRNRYCNGLKLHAADGMMRLMFR